MSWPIVRLADVCSIQIGKTPSRHEPRYWGASSNVWMSISDLGKSRFASSSKETISDVAVRETGIKTVPKGTVLMSFKLSIGKVAIAQRELYTNEAIAALIVKDKNLLCESYLAHAVEAIDFSEAGARAVMGATLNKKSLAEIKIPLPPLEEQKRIAGILDQADALRRLRARALEKLNTLGQAVFQEMFGGLSFDTKLSSITVKITDGTHAAPEWSQTQEVPFLFVSSIKGQNIDFNTGKFVTENEYASLMRRTDLSAGDILYTCVGSYGNTAIVPESAKFVFQRHIAHLKPKPDLLTSEYLSFALESPSARAQADKTATGIAQKTMTLKALRELKIPLAPIDLQQEFGCRITQIKEQTKKIENVLQHEGALFSSLQSAAFQGKL